MSGSADKDVKFWEFESKDGGNENVGVYMPYSRDIGVTCFDAGTAREVLDFGSHTDLEDDGRRAVC